MARQTVLAPAAEDTPARMSYDEFLRWVPDGVQAEWVDGEVFIVTTSACHVRIARLFTMVLQTFVEARGLGEAFPAPFQMRIPSRPSGREPDVLVLRAEHLDRVKRLWVEGPADLVVEIISEESVTIDRVDKLREYQQAGVPEYLIVDGREGRQGFEFYRLVDDGRYLPVTPDGDGRYHSLVLPGLWFDPLWFSRDPLPTASAVLAAIAAAAL